MTLKDAPELTYLEAMEPFENGIEDGSVIFKDGEQVYVLGGLTPAYSPDGYDEPCDGLNSILCRVIQPGETFIVEVEDAN